MCDDTTRYRLIITVPYRCRGQSIRQAALIDGRSGCGGRDNSPARGSIRPLKSHQPRNGPNAPIPGPGTVWRTVHISRSGLSLALDEDNSPRRPACVCACVVWLTRRAARHTTARDILLSIGNIQSDTKLSHSLKRGFAGRVWLDEMSTQRFNSIVVIGSVGTCVV